MVHKRKLDLHRKRRFSRWKKGAESTGLFAKGFAGFAKENMSHGFLLFRQTFSSWNEHIRIANTSGDIEETNMAATIFVTDGCSAHWETSLEGPCTEFTDSVIAWCSEVATPKFNEKRDRKERKNGETDQMVTKRPRPGKAEVPM